MKGNLLDYVYSKALNVFDINYQFTASLTTEKDKTQQDINTPKK